MSMLRCVVVLFVLFAPAASADSLVLAVVPRLPPLETHQAWTPLLDLLRKRAGVDIELRVSKTFSEFEKQVFSGQADLVFVNPYQQVELHKTLGMVPLVRDSARKLSGVLVVRSDSKIKDVSELRGATIAFPHPNAFGASLHMRALLKERFGVDVRPIYVETHGNVYRHVVFGKALAGGGVNVTLNNEPESLRSQLRVLYEAPGVSPHPLSAHPRVPVALRGKIVSAILDLAQDPAGRAALAAVTLTQPVRASYAVDYQSLEQLHLDRYYVPTDIPEAQ